MIISSTLGFNLILWNQAQWKQSSKCGNIFSCPQVIYFCISFDSWERGNTLGLDHYIVYLYYLSMGRAQQIFRAATTFCKSGGRILHLGLNHLQMDINFSNG